MRLLSAIAACLIMATIASPSFAQSPVQPYYGVTSSTGAKGFQPVDATHGLPQGARAIATCGSQSLTAGIIYPVTQDLTGTLCVTTGGGGGGTAVTIANGADIAEGNTADAAATAGSTGTVSSKLRLMTTQLGTINSTLGSPFQAGGSIGNTSFGATQATAANLNATVVGTGTFATQATLAAETTKVIGTVNQGTSPWVTSGTSTVSGTVSATQGTSPWIIAGGGTAGSAATGVATIQGIASMTPVQVTVANGSDTAEGTTTDSPAALPTSTTAATQIALLKTLNNTANSSIPAGTNSIGFVNPPSSSSAIGIAPIVSASGESSHVLKASAGNAYAIYATNLTGTAGFLLVLNSTTAPGDGAVTPLACAPLSPNGIASLNYAPGPPGVFSTGITAVVTSATTCFTKTTGVITAFISGLVQ